MLQQCSLVASFEGRFSGERFYCDLTYNTSKIDPRLFRNWNHLSMGPSMYMGELPEADFSRVTVSRVEVTLRGEFTLHGSHCRSLRRGRDANGVVSSFRFVDGGAIVVDVFETRARTHRVVRQDGTEF